MERGPLVLLEGGRRKRGDGGLNALGGDREVAGD